MSFAGIDNLYAGIATHYCPSSKIGPLEQALIDLEDVNDIEAVLDHFCPKVNAEFSLEKHFDQINKCFSASTVEEILKSLEDNGTDWARDTVKVSSFVFICRNQPKFLKIQRFYQVFVADIEIGIAHQFEVSVEGAPIRI